MKIIYRKKTSDRISVCELNENYLKEGKVITTLRGTREIIGSGCYKNGRKHGVFVRKILASGRTVEMTWENGFRCGIYKSHSKNGRLRSEGVLKYGLLHGEYNTYTKRGINHKEYYENGMRQGRSYVWFGRILETVRKYKNDHLIKSIKIIGTSKIKTVYKKPHKTDDRCVNILGIPYCTKSLDNRVETIYRGDVVLTVKEYLHDDMIRQEIYSKNGGIISVM
jgi:antitoxin component YwqK of YwqJK toxin-antitoxin module